MSARPDGARLEPTLKPSAAAGGERGLHFGRGEVAIVRCAEADDEIDERFALPRLPELRLQLCIRQHEPPKFFQVCLRHSCFG